MQGRTNDDDDDSMRAEEDHDDADAAATDCGVGAACNWLVAVDRQLVIQRTSTGTCIDLFIWDGLIGNYSLSAASSKTSGVRIEV